MKILIIEDTKVVSTMFKLLLEQRGFDVCVVETLRDAEKILAVTVFDVILLDLVLPNGEGVSTVKKMYMLSPNTPIVVITGMIDLDIETQSILHGAQEFLQKPVDPNMLVHVINRAVTRHQVRKSFQPLEKSIDILKEKIEGKDNGPSSKS